MSDCYEMLVPKNHFLRKLDKAIDFSFVEDLCREKYHVVNGGPGRPAEPPVRLFKLLLLMFLYQVKFERAMERMTNDTISWRWFCGYAPDEPVASHKTMWLFRKRLGPDVFDSIFTEILNRCIYCGFDNLNIRKRLDADGVIDYISMMKPGTKTDVLGSERFKVTNNDECYCVECPAKRLMQLRSSFKDGYLQYKGIGCSECSLRERCTQNKTGIRTFSLNLKRLYTKKGNGWCARHLNM